MSLRANTVNALQSCKPKHAQPSEKDFPQVWQAVLSRPLQLHEACVHLCLALQLTLLAARQFHPLTGT